MGLLIFIFLLLIIHLSLYFKKLEPCYILKQLQILVNINIDINPECECSCNHTASVYVTLLPSKEMLCSEKVSFITGNVASGYLFSLQNKQSSTST